MRNNCYSFMIKGNTKTLNVDYRKSIRNAILFYGPERLKDDINKWNPNQ